MGKHPTEMSKYRVSEIVKGILDDIGTTEVAEPRKVKPFPVNEVHSPAGMIRLEAGFWFAYPKDGEPNKMGPFEAAIDATRALDDRTMRETG